MARLQTKFTPWLLQRRGPTGTVAVQCGYSYIEDTPKTWNDLMTEAEAMLNESTGESKAA